MGGKARHEKDELLTIPIGHVRCGEGHIRQSGLATGSLKCTIEDAGLLQPILAQPDGRDGFLVIDGARRLAALRELGVQELIVGRDIVIDPEETEADVRFKQIIANIQREDLNPVELGQAFVSLKEEFGYQYSEVAEIIGKTPHYVAAKVGLVKRLDPEVRQLYLNDLAGVKCIANTSDAGGEERYVVQVTVLEGIARMPQHVQKAAYEATRAAELDWESALAYLRSLKGELIKVGMPGQPEGERVPPVLGADAAEAVTGRRQAGVRRHVRKLNKYVEKLAETVNNGQAEPEIAEELEALADRLSRLARQLKEQGQGSNNYCDEKAPV